MWMLRGDCDDVMGVRCFLRDVIGVWKDWSWVCEFGGSCWVRWRDVIMY